MRQDIVLFLRKACKKWGMHAVFIPDERGGTYFVHKNGRAIQTFVANDFYQLPKRYRMFMYGPLIHVGLSHNLGERTKETVIGKYRMGKKIA